MISASTRKLIEASKGIQGIDKVITRVSGDAVNAVAVKHLGIFRQKVYERYNLTKQYISQRSGISKWRPTGTDIRNVWSSINARYRHTTLGTYGFKQLKVRAKHPERAKGDPYHGIPAGYKQAGLAVGILRDGRTTSVSRFFSAGLLNTKQRGVFLRKSSNMRGIRGGQDIQNRYGPSVHQAMKFLFNRDKPLVEVDLFLQLDRDLKTAVKAEMAKQQL